MSRIPPESRFSNGAAPPESGDPRETEASVRLPVIQHVLPPTACSFVAGGLSQGELLVMREMLAIKKRARQLLAKGATCAEADAYPDGGRAPPKGVDMQLAILRARWQVMSAQREEQWRLKMRGLGYDV